jgi:hypothetical protein
VALPLETWGAFVGKALAEPQNRVSGCVGSSQVLIAFWCHWLRLNKQQIYFINNLNYFRLYGPGNSHFTRHQRPKRLILSCKRS